MHERSLGHRGPIPGKASPCSARGGVANSRAMADENREQAFREAVDQWRAVVNADAGARDESHPHWMSHDAAVLFLADHALVEMGFLTRIGWPAGG